MACILFEAGKKIGQISEWVLIERPAQVKNVLGKEVLMPKPKDQCTFTSPKPIPKRSDLILICDHKLEYILKVTYVRGGTFVTADIIEQRKMRI